jgi:hypothetical protein
MISLAQDEGDVHDLQENLPVRVTDAIASSGIQVQARILTSRERPGGTEAEVEPQVQWGFARRTHVQMAGVMIASSREESTNSGDLGLVLFHQLNEARAKWPVFAVSAGFDAPTGIDSAGLDTRVRGIVTQMLDADSRHRIHVNYEWLRNAGKREDERTNAWLATAGYSCAATRNVVVIFDAARLQQRALDEVVNLVEAGVRGRAMRNLVISGGVSVGLGPNSPKAQFTVGLERSF